MKLLLSALAIVGMLLVGGTIVAPALALSPPSCTIFGPNAPDCVERPIFAPGLGGDGCARHAPCDKDVSSSAP